jgi:hypothetical protein
MSRLVGRSGAVLMLIGTSIGLPPLAAQTNSEMICMVRPAPQFSTGIAFALVPSEAGSVMMGRGFTPIPCVDGQVNVAAYRSRFCGLADGDDESTKQQVQNAFRTTPRELCDWANALTASS